MNQVLWRKLPVGVRQERMGGKLCPLDGWVETHALVPKDHFSSSPMFHTVRRAFGLVSMGPSRSSLDACCWSNICSY